MGEHGAGPGSRDGTIHVRIWIAAPRQRVFAALSEGRELMRWWPKDATTEPRIGGSIHLDWFPPASGGMDSRFDLFEQDVELAYPFYSERLHFRLCDENGGTTLDIHHRCSADAAVHVAQSWGFLTANLKAWIEHGFDLRS